MSRPQSFGPVHGHASGQAWAFVGAWRWLPGEDRVVAGEDVAVLYGIERRVLRAGADAALFSEAVHPDDRRRLADQLRNALRYGAAIDIEYRLADAADGLRWAWIQGSCVATRDGRPIEYLGSVHQRAEDMASDPLSQACDHLLAAGALSRQAGHVALARLTDMSMMEAGRLLAARAEGKCVPLRRTVVAG